MTVVAVEGLDGSGKGTVCALLAQALGATIYKSPPDHMRAEQDHINATATDEEHYRYFIKVTQEASRQVAILSRSGNVVMDRYWPTTIVYHRAMGLDARIEDLGEIFIPDCIIYLTVGDEEQARRINGRGGMSPGDKRMDGRQDLIRSNYELVLAGARNVVTIDTGEILPQRVAELALQAIRSLR